MRDLFNRHVAVVILDRPIQCGRLGALEKPSEFRDDRPDRSMSARTDERAGGVSYLGDADEEGTALIRHLWIVAIGAAFAVSVAGCAGSHSGGTAAGARPAAAPSAAARQGALPWWIVWGEAPAGSSQKYTVFQGSKQNVYAGESGHEISGPYYSGQAADNAARHNGHGPNPDYLTEPVIQTSYGPVSGSCLATLRDYSEQQLKQVEMGAVRPSQCGGVKNGALLDAANDIGQQKWQSWS